LVDSWLASYQGMNSGRLSAIQRFERWLRDSGEVQSLAEAVRFQKAANGDDRYRIVDLIAKHVKEEGGTYSGMNWRYTTLRSFFFHARAELPKIRTNFMPTKDATVGQLTLDAFKILLKGSDLRDQAIYLTLFQGFLDQDRFFKSANPKGYEIGQHIREKGVNEPFRIDLLRGRKGNHKPFNTWIGKDALEAWRLYFERERGYPKPNEALVLDRLRKPLTKKAFYNSHLRKLKRLGFIKNLGGKDARYGYGVHELRDLARSIVEKAIPDKFNPKSAEYWMGHTQKVDPLFYNKIWKLDPEYNLSQYRIAERYLSVVSGSALDSERIKEQEDRMLDMEREIVNLKAVLQDLYLGSHGGVPIVNEKKLQELRPKLETS